MATAIYVERIVLPEYNRGEILRYAGDKGNTLETVKLVDECLREVDGKMVGDVCYAEFPLSIEEDSIDFEFAKIKSKDLAKNLKNCDRAIIFSATVGIGIDRLITKYGSISPAKALIFQAIGAERIESLCELFNQNIKEKYKHVRPRFSPGYGDLTIKTQRDIFGALDCSKKIGLTLNESLIMSPSKSVTGFIGIANAECEVDEPCEKCNKTDCEFRRI